MIAMTYRVLDRLEAWRAGDQARIAAIDAQGPKDQRAMAAMFAAAFGIAERTLNVVDHDKPGEAARLIDDYREQTDEQRQQLG